MTLEISLGWWLLPTGITTIAFVYAAIRNEQENPNGDYGTYGTGAIYTMFAYGGALIVSLVAWLIWSLLT